jgi:hypothetical protein
MLNDVARTGGSIDRSVNPGLLPGEVLNNPTLRPEYLADKSDLWVQGFNIGLLIAR